ncbi:MAG: hypothetical protein Q8L34_00755 [Candidatus Woesearchaeota archaeon]|nr:hypothetical protein [Candidatus Woesearchaeota archaeon]
MTENQENSMFPLGIKHYASIAYTSKPSGPVLSRRVVKEIKRRDLKEVFVSPLDADLVFYIRLFDRFFVDVPGERLLGMRRNYSAYVIGTEVALQDITEADQRTYDINRPNTSGEVKKYVLTSAGTYLELRKKDATLVHLISFDDLGGIETLTEEVTLTEEK